MKIYKNIQTGETLVDTQQGGLADTKTGITTYDTDIINKVTSFAGEDGSDWEIENVEPNIFDVVPKCVNLDGEPLDDTIDH
jgi:hypothetical protein